MDIKDVLAGKDINGEANAPRNCGDDSEDHHSTDFEDWVPSDELGAPECILGQQYTYRRIARTQRASACFLPKDYVLPTAKAAVRCSRCEACVHACDDSSLMSWIVPCPVARVFNVLQSRRDCCI